MELHSIAQTLFVVRTICWLNAGHESVERESRWLVFFLRQIVPCLAEHLDGGTAEPIKRVDLRARKIVCGEA